MKRLGLFLMVPLPFGADSEVAQKEVAALIQKADQAIASNRTEEAETAYKAAIEQCDVLPPDRYHCKTDVLWKLGRLSGQVGDSAGAEAVYKERVSILLAHRKAGERPDLDLGIALFDLQSVIEGESLKSTGRESEGLDAFGEGAIFLPEL